MLGGESQKLQPPRPSIALEQKLHRKLNIPRGIVTVHSRDSAKSAIGDRRVRRTEPRVVERVEHFHPELQVVPARIASPSERPERTM